MAATSSGALKALIEGGGLGLAAYRDAAPEGASPPYVIIHEAISVVPSPSNARYDRAGTSPTGIETVQVSLWQRWRKPVDGTVGESYSLPDALADLIDGASLTTAPTHVWGVRFISSVRFVDREQDLTHHALTVELVRDF